MRIILGFGDEMIDGFGAEKSFHEKSARRLTIRHPDEKQYLRGPNAEEGS
jgi:hypothetical protein